MVEQSMQHSGETRRQHLSAAYAIAAGLTSGKRTLSGLNEDIESRSRRCLDGRLQSMAAQWTEIAADKNIERLIGVVDSLAIDDEGIRLPFADFKAKVEDDVAGFVVTAHPTFSLSADAWEYAGEYLRALTAGTDTKKATEGAPPPTVPPPTPTHPPEQKQKPHTPHSKKQPTILILYKFIFYLSS